MAIRISKTIVDRLMEAGLIPKHCARVELHVPPNSAMTLRYDVYVADEHWQALGEAFLAMAKERRDPVDE